MKTTNRDRRIWATAKLLGDPSAALPPVEESGLPELIPVITNVVTALPGLILGALLLERIFQIPGLGSLMVEALANNDESIVMGMTYVLSIVYCVLLLVTDILYAMVDPRVSLR